MRVVRKDNSAGLAYAIGLASVITVLAQMADQLTIAVLLVWACVFVYVSVRHGKEIVLGGYTLLFSFVGLVFGFYSAICFFASGEEGYVTGFLVLYIKSYFMYLVGLVSFSAIGTSLKEWKIVIVFYAIGALIYLAWAMLTYFPGFVGWLSNTTYLFVNKNSMGQICAVACLALAALLPKASSWWTKCAFGLCAVLLLVGILIMQCRTAAIGAAFGIAGLLLYRKKAKLLAFLAVALLIAIAISPTLQNFLQHAFFLDIYSNATADELSSGRLSKYDDALLAIRGHELFGLGAYYVDSLYINILANVGIMGFLILMTIWVPRILINFGGLNSRAVFSKSGDIYWLEGLLAALTILYCLESFLEGYAPFGPGTSSFLFWALCGCRDAAMSRLSVGVES